MNHDSYWTDIPGEPLYQAHPEGKIRSKERNIVTRNRWSTHTRLCPSRELTLNKSNIGYLVISLAYNGTKKQGSVHRLIAQTFIPNPENKPCVNHIDGNKLNNNVWNLEWATHKENTAHALKIKLIDNCGYKNPNASLTRKQAISIREEYHGYAQASRAKLAVKYKISSTIVERLIANKTYKDC